jgi:N-acetylglucosamine-6-phosphate deacetylase
MGHIKTDQKNYVIISNGTILTPQDRIDDGIVIIRDSVIVDVGKRGAIEEPAQAERIDAGGNYIAPGFVNIHVHGGKGADVTKITPETFKILAGFFAGHGVTSYLATALTSPGNVIFEVLDKVRSIIGSLQVNGANILGVHMEGPYLSPAQSGAHPRSLLSLPRPEHYMPFLEYSDVLRQMTLAPELDGAAFLVRDLRKKGIVAAAGHTDGIFPEIIRAIDEGITHATHFFCNMSHFRRDNLKRVAGAVETLLYDDRITGELIADGWHLDPSLMKLLLKVKSCERVCFVTDAMPATGLPDGRYFMGEVEAIVEKGIARLPDNSAYAGSVTTMDVCVRNGMSLLDLSLQDSLRMATLTPSEIIRVDKRKGSLEKNKDADIIIIDENANVLKTIIMGKLFYTGELSG